MKNLFLKNALSTFNKNVKTNEIVTSFSPEVLTSSEQGKIFGGCNHCKSGQVIMGGPGPTR